MVRDLDAFDLNGCPPKIFEMDCPGSYELDNLYDDEKND